jgi:hypothetical protein
VVRERDIAGCDTVVCHRSARNLQISRFRSCHGHKAGR